MRRAPERRTEPALSYLSQAIVNISLKSTLRRTDCPDFHLVGGEKARDVPNLALSVWVLSWFSRVRRASARGLEVEESLLA